MADLRCPQCGKPNPEDLDLCQFCDARLRPLEDTAPHGMGPIHAGEKPIMRQTSEFEKVKLPDNGPIRVGDQPTRKNTGELERSLPTWLKSLREGGGQGDAAMGGDTPPAAGPTPGPVAAEGGDLPLNMASNELTDWLSGLGAAGEDDNEDIPDWLAGLDLPIKVEVEDDDEAPAPVMGAASVVVEAGGNEGASLPALEAGSGDGNLPDWLSGLGLGETPQTGASMWQDSPAVGGGSVPEESEPTLGEPSLGEAAPAENLPAWLEALKSQAAGPEAVSLSSEENQPDWLSSLPSIQSEITNQPESMGQTEGRPATQDVSPEWLEQLKENPPDPSKAEATPVAEDGEEQPAWLAGMSVGATPAAFTHEPQSVEKGPVELPNWLSQLQSDVNKADQAKEEEKPFQPATGPFSTDDSHQPLPDWLSNIDLTANPSASAPALVMSDEGGSGGGGGETGQAAFSLETPDWLSHLRPERSAEIPPALEGGSEPENLEVAELPSWVQAMRPVESVQIDPRTAEADVVGPAEASGPLAGLRGTLPATPGLEFMRKPPAYASTLQLSNNQQRYIAQLEKVVMEEGQARTIKQVRPISSLIWRLGISLVMMVAVLVPLVLNRQVTPDMALYPQEWETTNLALNAIPDNSTVLLVFDYEPAFAGELETAASSVIDMMLYRGIRLAIVSTTPTGPALAEQFLDETQGYHLDGGTLYTNLGYLAGGPAGMAFFANNPVAAMPVTVGGEPAWESPALAGITTLDGFGAVILLTDNADLGRSWIEQTREKIGSTPLLMIISAQAEPMLRPYFDAGQIGGLVTGLAGGKVYEQTYNTPGLARNYWDSFGLGTLAAVVLMAVGGAWGALSAWKSRKKTGDEA